MAENELEEKGETLIMMPDLCYKHRHEVIHAAQFAQNEPWRALVIVTQIVLFQAATCSDTVHKKLDGDMSRVSELGCLACRLHQRWKQVIAAAKTRDLANVKALGVAWVAERIALNNNG